MKKLALLCLPFLGALLLSCQNGTPTLGSNSSAPSLSEVNPETSSPNTDLEPAFIGQTRIKGVKTTTPYTVEVLNTDLGSPWAVIQMPDSRFLITDKEGWMYLVSQDGKTSHKIEGLPAVDSKAQGGLLDVALDPNFAQNRLIYWSYSEPVNGGNHTSVAKGSLSPDEKSIESIEVIFRATPVYDGKLHYGSRLIFDKSGALYVSTGERSDRQTRPLAQDGSAYIGKILKLTPQGDPAIATGQGKGWKPEIYSIGHRNPQGLAFHPETQDLWETEFGPRGGDELNRIEPGLNYGWPIITYGREYSGAVIGEGIAQKEGYSQPVYYWDPVVSPSGIDFYTGSIDEWKNNLFIGCLSGKKIIRLVLENQKVVGEEWLLADSGERFRDVLSAQDGHLYAVTDSGKLYKISKK